MSKNTKDPNKSSTGQTFEDYFQSKFHTRRMESAFKRTSDKVVKVGLEVGVMEAISEAQGMAGAVAHFYEYTGMAAQGAAYFRRLADTIEKGGFTPPENKKE